MKIIPFILLLMMALHTNAADSLSLTTEAQKLLYAVKTGGNYGEWRTAINNAAESDITSQLSTDDLRKAFWLNMYNAYIQILLKEDPSRYQHRSSFFSSPLIPVAGKLVSLDFIEHGILRRSKMKIAMGYVNNFFPSALEKKWRVDKLDYRIHFALNCGAKSCPPVAFYSPEKLGAQLSLAAKGYLTANSIYDSANNTVKVPMILSWFRGDFGSGPGVRKILTEQNIIPENTIPKIEYIPYDWDLEIGHYIQ